MSKGRNTRADAYIQDIIASRRAKRVAQGKRKKALPKPLSVLPPDNAERAYLRKIRSMVAELQRLTAEKLFPEIPALAEEARRDIGHRDSAERRDDYPDKIGMIMRGIRVEFFRKFTDKEVEKYVRESAQDTDEHSRRQLAKNFKRVLGIDLFSGISDRGLRNQFDTFLKENVALITSMNEEYFKKVETMTLRTVSTGAPTAELAENLKGFIKKEVKNKEARAKFIARDQISKLNGRLTQVRQSNLGITKYRWSTLNDMRVRGRPGGFYPKAEPSHWERKNKIFSWDDPPEGGHPGEDYNCRCTAIPVFEDAE